VNGAIPAGNPAEINKPIAQGFRFFLTSNDLLLMTAGASDLLSKVPGSEGGLTKANTKAKK
jgi:hypothetical protein